jgi:hypothetical protein
MVSSAAQEHRPAALPGLKRKKAAIRAMAAHFGQKTSRYRPANGGSFYTKSAKITLPGRPDFPHFRWTRYNLLQLSNLRVPAQQQFGNSVDYTNPERVREDGFYHPTFC